MHILEIPSFFTPYGGEFCLEQAQALKAVGHEVRILSNVQLGFSIGGKDYLVLPSCRYEHERDGITVYQSFQRGVPKAVRWNMKRWVAIVCDMFDDYVARYGKPDVLHAHCTKWAGYAAMKISGKYGIPYVITEHLPYEIYVQEFGPPPCDGWQIPLLKEALRRAATVITVSEELVDRLSVYFGTDYHSVFISNTVDVDFYSYRDRRPLDGRPFCFCCLGIYDDRKGYDVLFEAFDQLGARCSEVELYVAGRGTDSQRFRHLFQSLRCSDKVHALGELDKTGVRDLLYQSDALVLATRGETQGLVLLEALSTGIPVISTEAIPPSVRLNEASWFVDVDDAAGLADMMGRLVAGGLSYDGVKASRMVCEMASLRVIGEKVAKVLSDACRHQ